MKKPLQSRIILAAIEQLADGDPFLQIAIQPGEVRICWKEETEGNHEGSQQV